jgi:type IV secretory pathway VirB2 component (pilin)
MSDAFSPSITLSEDTVSAIEELKSRGMRFRERGLRVLGVAGAAAVMAICARFLHMNAEPMSAFTTIDLPALSRAVASITSGPSGLASPFNSAFDSIYELLTGTFAKAMAIGIIAVSGMLGVASGKISTAIAGVMAAVPIMVMPMVLDTLGIGGSQSTQQANDIGFLQQMVEEKRYKDLAGAADELMPSKQAAYVKAQIAYLIKDQDSLKNELNSLTAGKSDKWSPNWERMNVLETEAFGTPRSKETIAFADDARSSMQTYQKILGSSGALAVVASILGGSLFGFGMMIVSRVRRLEAILGTGKKSPSGLIGTTPPQADTVLDNSPASIQLKVTD